MAMTEYSIESTLAGYETHVGDDGKVTVDSMDGRIWRIVPEIVVTRHSDGPCGPRSSCGFIAGGGRPYASSVEAAKAMCPEGLEFSEPDANGVMHADDGTHAYNITEGYRVMCGFKQVHGEFPSLLKARGAIVRLIGTSFGY